MLPLPPRFSLQADICPRPVWGAAKVLRSEQAVGPLYRLFSACISKHCSVTTCLQK